MARRRTLYFEPAVESKSQWTATGAATDLAAVTKGVLPPVVPSTSAYIASTTTTDQDVFDLPELPPIAADEHVSYLRAWCYATTQANHTIDLALTYAEPSNGYQHVAGHPAITVPASSSAAWFSTPRLSPRRRTAGGATYLTDELDDPLQITVTLTESSAQAATSKIYALVVEVGVSTMEHLDIDGRDFVGVETREPYRPRGGQSGLYTFGSSSLDDWRTTILSMQEVGMNILRVHVPFNDRFMTNSTTVNETGFTEFETFLDLCEGYGMRLDVTGLNLYNPAERPSWLDALSEANRWATFAAWWKRMAQACAGSPVPVFLCLINEPLVVATPNGDPGSWYTGHLGASWFGAYLNRTHSGRSGATIASTWISTMRTQIRVWEPARGCAVGDFITAASPSPFPPYVDVGCFHNYLEANGSAATTVQVLEVKDHWDALATKPLVLEECGNLTGGTDADLRSYWATTWATPYLTGIITGLFPDMDVVAEDDIGTEFGQLAGQSWTAFVGETVADELERLVFDGVSFNRPDTPTIFGFAFADLGYMLRSVELSPPAKRYERARATDGTDLVRRPRYDDREITLRLETNPQVATDRALEAIALIRSKIQKADRIAADGGRGLELTWTPSGSVRTVTMYVTGGDIAVPKVLAGDDVGWFQARPPIDVTLTCRPFLYGETVTQVPVTMAGPQDWMVLAGVAGDVAAEGTAVVRETSGQNRRLLEWGLERNKMGLAEAIWAVYPSYLYVADDFSTGSNVGGSIQTDSGATTASHVYRATLFPSSFAVAGMDDLWHVGRYRVRARLKVSAATGQFRLRYRIANGNWQALDWQTSPAPTTFTEVELGTVTIPQADIGNQTWSWRIDGLGTSASEVLSVDYLVMVPCEDGWGKSVAQPAAEEDLPFLEWDSFNGMAAAAVLNGRTPTFGTGPWATSGDTGDYASDGAGTLVRATVSGSGWRFGVLPTAYTTTQITLAFENNQFYLPPGTAGGHGQAIMARWVDANNFAVAAVQANEFGAWLYILVTVAATNVFVAASSQLGTLSNVPMKLAFSVHASGVMVASVGLDGFPPLQTVVGWHSAVGTGGALASGKAGIGDYNIGAFPVSRKYKEFAVSAAEAEDVMLPSSHRFRIQGNGRPAMRENEPDQWSDSPYNGSRLWIPEAGDDGDMSRLAILMRRTDIDQTTSAGQSDSHEVKLWYTPRYLDVPGS